jgi:hypothetical protein
MRIDESLARGLARQLIKDWLEKTENVINALKKSFAGRSIRPKMSFSNYTQKHKNLLGPLCFNYLETGTKKHPVNGYIFAIAFTDREYKGWTENGIRGIIDLEFEDFAVYNFFKTKFKGVNYATFHIGEHVITRIIQRSFTQENIKKITPENLVKKFSYVPVWSALWICIFGHSIFKNEFTSAEIESFGPIIPTDDGLFFCKINIFDKEKGFQLLEVRTYINCEQFDEEQKELYDFLLTVSSNLTNTSYTLFPFIAEITKEFAVESELIYKVMMTRLQKNVDLIASNLARNEKDNFTSYRIVKAIQAEIDSLKFSEEHFIEIDKMLSENSPSEFHVIIKRSVFKELLN